MTFHPGREIVVPMRVDLIPWESWDLANARLREIWQLSGGSPLHLHKGLMTGVHEIAVSLAQVFSHKRALGVVKGNTWAFDGVLPWFLKEAYQVQGGMLSELNDASKIEAWARAMKKETAFVLLSEDHPVTGATWNWEIADRVLNEMKIFVLRVSHSTEMDVAVEMLPYSCRICSLSPEMAVSIAGSKWRVNAPLSSGFAWDIAAVEKEIARRQIHLENRAAVEKFEAQFLEQRFFKNEESRRYDRAVLQWEDLSAEALLQSLGKVLKTPAFDEGMDTANACRWKTPKVSRGWWQNAPSSDQLRGLAVFSAALVADSQFVTTLNQTITELKKRQSW